MNIELRTALPEDMEQVHRLVYELAVFEKEPQEVITSAELYKKDCFEENRFDVIVAVDIEKNDGQNIIGIALTYWAYSTWKGKYLWLDDLIVTEAYRGKKIGKMLFDAVVEKAAKEGAALMRWQVLDWNKPAINFYNQYETIYQKEWITCKLNHEAIHKLMKNETKF